MDIATVMNIIEMINRHSNDIKALMKDTRPSELRDSSWVFKNEFVGYGADKALSDLRNHLQSFIESELNALENQSPE